MDSEDRAEPSSSTTSTSLMQRIRSDDPSVRQLAWKTFALLYVPMIWEWCRSRRLRPHDADDVSQAVFAEVYTTIGTHREGPFREWLWGVTRRVAFAHYRRRARGPQAAGGSDVLRWVNQVADKSPPDSSIVPSRHPILARALRLIRPEFDATTWQAFQRMVCDGQPAKVVAGELGWGESPAGAKRVRQAKFRVLKRLREEYGDFLDLP